MKKIIVCNLILFILALFLLEFVSMILYCKKIRIRFQMQNSKDLIQKIKYTKARNYSTDDFLHLFTKTMPKNPTKRPILVIGCSYVHGSGLEEEQTFSYKLFQKTNREVYKRGIPGGGIQLALHQFETGEIQKDVSDAEYIIYIYVDYHLQRLYDYQLDYVETLVNQRYKLKDNKLVKINQPKFPFYYSLFSVKTIQQAIEEIKTDKEIENYSLFNAVMEKLMKEAKNSYKDTKFIILLYPSGGIMFEDTPIMPQSEIENLKKMGFIVINAENLTTKPIRREEYRIDDHDHPNEQAWDAVIDNFVKTVKF